MSDSDKALTLPVVEVPIHVIEELQNVRLCCWCSRCSFSFVFI